MKTAEYRAVAAVPVVGNGVTGNTGTGGNEICNSLKINDFPLPCARERNFKNLGFLRDSRSRSP